MTTLEWVLAGIVVVLALILAALFVVLGVIGDALTATWSAWWKR